MRRTTAWRFNDSEKRLIHSLVTKGRAEEATNDAFTIISSDDFYSLFETNEVDVLKKWLAIDPKSIDYKLPFLGAGDTVADVIPIKNQRYTFKGQLRTIPCQYLPKNVYEAYVRMNEAMTADINKQLLVLYGYRSPARQVFMFFDILEGIYDFDFDKTMQRVCFPNYSEHVCVGRQAIDFQTQDGLPSEAFSEAEEYAWLRKNAAKFGFCESYPKGNKLGMMYEPWHWHYAVNER